MNAPSFTTYYHSPIGYMCIQGNMDAIQVARFCERPGPPQTDVPPVGQACLQQLAEYFKGTRQSFDLPLQPAGTTFQQQVWEHLKLIPFGKTRSYLEVARAVSGEKAIRAVGGANGKNPLCLLVPCHRVIGSDGSLTGYAGGVWRKEWLLLHEGVLQPEQQLSLF
ncbi:methylated-DNA--[protein]-cysteine S-methyltransferase [Pontibacter liquoris]|uniref:methylated-DNA--[protein]-cysteine S-methyltransferase n=1 Tax=Pontibacter liquoris TaxID=2905677 RepID=UPI001FA6CF47|nr:methylated-DNA--[protein]-cysteine S-methyltransferase [Pontibacter liquoris]